MLQIYSTYASPLDDLFYQFERQTLYPRHSPLDVFPRPVNPRFGSYRFCSLQQANTGRTSVQVKQVENDNNHQIHIYNARGYKGFDVEVVKRGREYYLVIESEIDSFERVFRLNKSLVDLNNIELQVNDDDELLITLPYNREVEKERAANASRIAKRKVERRKEQIRQKKQELEQLEKELVEDEQLSRESEEKLEQLNRQDEEQQQQEEEEQQQQQQEDVQEEEHEKSSEAETSETEDIVSDTEVNNIDETTQEEPQVEKSLSRSSSHSPTLEDAEDEEFISVSKP
ncbi:uncharacterized protein SPAPADRAFT_57891 [Spathaspora passalidarum NRRL Y-27907]|uniref:Uncharacterized protein n=1 Tax=Spathaspora passalidarum (strain NRRL Y-27907 / 11-Y1) TaxID=619300 RepID=G3AF08_SPAPN|nr:uncharacterized protein SPAPADRAFT_57891 [Spathaspora passalidarum NRRL Y-27907]EGW34812.1 hypothetical protein SPAPADRAFT_57891 [Spathaspora passalidarum NRRL Y-27907]